MNLTRSVLLCVLVLLNGCSGGGSAIVDTFRFAAKASIARDHAPSLDPRFSYLRVTVDGRVAFLALGNVDQRPGGAVDVWYSGGREVISLQNGRVISVIGTQIEWRDVVLPPMPSWSMLAKQAEFPWTRIRNAMPGYRYGIKDSLRVKPIPSPDKTSIQGYDPDGLMWFEESSEGLEPLPPARYAVSLVKGTEEVVYGEQCLSASFCFAWQRWSAGMSSLNDKN